MDYHAPTTLQGAMDLLAPQKLTILAGGTDLFAAQPPGRPQRGILDLTRINGLRGISHGESGTRIGGATRWSDIANADLPAYFDGLRTAARQIGSLQIQNAGTIAGNICNASPAADGVPPLLTLGAQVELSCQRGTRVIPLADFLTGVRQTLLTPDELLSAIVIPPAPQHANGAFSKLGSRAYLVISITMSAAIIGCDTDGRIDVARIAIGACSAVARRLPELEADLLGRTPDQIEITPHHLASLSPISDVRGSARYRLDAVAEQCARTIRKAAQLHG